MVEIIVIIQQIIASFTHLIAKGVTHDISPPLVLFYRSAIAAFIYVLWMLFTKKKLVLHDKKDIFIIFILGVLNIPINQFLFLESIKLTSPPNVALAYALTPGFVLVIAMLFLKEKATFLKIMGISIAIIGTVIVLFEKGFNFSSKSFIGDLLALTAAFAWALYTVIGKNFSMKYGATYSTALSMITGFILYIPIFIFLNIPLAISTIIYINWLQILYLAIFSSVLAYALWYYALKKRDASKISVFNNLQPILTTILSIFFLNYHLSAYFVVGGILIIIGIYITQKG
jgi:drug/metabolite transporter (DMT)-like permease